MYVRVDINFTGFSEPGGKRSFWRSFEAHRRGRFLDERPDLPHETIQEWERKFRLGFPLALQRLVNQEIADAWALRNETGRLPQPEITVRLIAVQYGSIAPILDIIGVQSTDIRDFVLLALSVYSPAAFNEALGSDFGLRASVEVLGDVPTKSNEKNIAPLLGRSSDAIGRAWIIANSSLVLPVVLALLVVYYLHQGLLQEKKDFLERDKDLRSERTENMKAIVDQNKLISASIVDHAKQTVVNEKAMQDALIALLRDRTPAPVRGPNP